MLGSVDVDTGLIAEDEGRRELRGVLRTFFREACPQERVRELAASARGYDEALWRRLATEVGVHGLAIPEQYGGAGFSFAELAVALEEAGRVLCSAPLLSTVVLAGSLLLESGDEAACARYLPGIADGSLTATVAGVVEAADVYAEAGRDGWKLHGRADLVLDGEGADLVLVPARTGNGPRLFACEPRPDADDCSRTARRVFDETRRMALLEFRGTAAVPVGEPEDAQRGTAAVPVGALADTSGVAAAVPVGVPGDTPRIPAAMPVEAPGGGLRVRATAPVGAPVDTSGGTTGVPVEVPADAPRVPATAPVRAAAGTSRGTAAAPIGVPGAASRTPATAPVGAAAGTSRGTTAVPVEVPADAPRVPATAPVRAAAGTSRGTTAVPVEVPGEASRIPATALVGGAAGTSRILAAVVDRGRVALSAEQVGGVGHVLDATVEYVGQRRQFGRQIGSFQAVKHRLADLLVELEAARSAAAYATACAVGAPAGLPIAASVAAAVCSEAYRRATAEYVQLHGGIGFTWEHPAHLYLRRARADEVLLGTAARHRARIAELLTAGPGQK